MVNSKEEIALRNLLASIRNSIGSNLFRNYYYHESGFPDGSAVVDVLKDGKLSCAYFLTSILLPHKLIPRVYFTVNTAVEGLLKSGWVKIAEPRAGCVVVWDALVQQGSKHFHLGFYVGDMKVVSNRSSMGVPGEHELCYSGLDLENQDIKATVNALYWHPALGLIE